MPLPAKEGGESDSKVRTFAMLQTSMWDFTHRTSPFSPI